LHFIHSFVCLVWVLTIASAVAITNGKAERRVITADVNIASVLDHEISTVNEFVSVDISVLFSSQDPLTYYQDGAPDGTVLNSSTGVISGTPTEVGSYSVSSSASDGNTTATANVFLMIVLYENGDFPSQTTTPSVSPTISTSISVSPTISSSVTNSISTSPSVSTVYEGPDGPLVANVLGTKIVVVDTDFSFDCAAAFNETDLVWWADNLPAGAAIDAATGVISGNIATAGSWGIQVLASQDGTLHTRSPPFDLIVCHADGTYPSL